MRSGQYRRPGKDPAADRLRRSQILDCGAAAQPTPIVAPTVALKSSSSAAIRSGSDWSMMARARRRRGDHVEVADALLDPRDVARRHRQFAQPEPEQQRGVARVAGHLAADADRDVAPRRRLDRELDQAQHAGMQRIVEMRRPARRCGRPPACTGSRSLVPIAKKSASAGERVGGQCRARHLDHRAERRQCHPAMRTPRRRSRRATCSIASRARRISLTVEIIGSRIRSGPRARRTQHRRELGIEQPPVLAATAGSHAGRAPDWRRRVAA